MRCQNAVFRILQHDGVGRGNMEMAAGQQKNLWVRLGVLYLLSADDKGKILLQACLFQISLHIRRIRRRGYTTEDLLGSQELEKLSDSRLDGKTVGAGVIIERLSGKAADFIVGIGGAADFFHHSGQIAAADA